MAECEITDLHGDIHTLDFDNLQSDYINVDCMEALKQMPDKCVDIAVVDPPYGIGENGSKNKSRRKLAIAKDYKAYIGDDSTPPQEIISKNFLEYRKIRLYGAQITISAAFHTIATVGLFGIKRTVKTILRIVN